MSHIVLQVAAGNCFQVSLTYLDFTAAILWQNHVPNQSVAKVCCNVSMLHVDLKSFSEMCCSQMLSQCFWIQVFSLDIFQHKPVGVCVCVCVGYRMRILCLKVGKSDTQGKEFATLWITTPELPLSATPALESPLCKYTFSHSCALHKHTRYQKPGQRLRFVSRLKSLTVYLIQMNSFFWCNLAYEQYIHTYIQLMYDRETCWLRKQQLTGISFIRLHFTRAYLTLFLLYDEDEIVDP